jgi:hypothetical protein
MTAFVLSSSLCSDALDEHSALREYFARFFEPSTVPDHAAYGAFLTKALLSAPLRPRVKRDKHSSLGRAWELAEHRATNGMYSAILRSFVVYGCANQICFMLWFCRQVSASILHRGRLCALLQAQWQQQQQLR